MALFKVLKGGHLDFEAKPSTKTTIYDPNNGGYQYTEGYCYFLTDTGKFYIDIGTGNNSTTPYDGTLRKAINAERADCDSQGNIIIQTYLKKPLNPQEGDVLKYENGEWTSSNKVGVQAFFVYWEENTGV